FQGLVGSKRTVRDQRTGEVRQVMADTAYLRQSIDDPNRLLVDGYPENLMPPVAGVLTEKQIGELVGYLEKLADPEFARLEAVRTPSVYNEWTMADFPEMGARVGAEPRDSAAVVRGRQAFMKAQCLQCHSVSGFGASLGPELVESVKKFQGKKLLQHILEPALEIHPQYQTSLFLLESGKIVGGTIVHED